MNAPQNTVERTLASLHLTTSQALDQRILAEAVSALRSAAARPERGAWHNVWGGRVGRFVAAAGMCAAVLVLVALLWDPEDTRERPTVQKPAAPDTPAGDQETRRLLAAERQEIEARYAARDVAGLILMLHEGRFENKILAARYLGEIGDDRALAGLSQLAGQWKGDPAENPFVQAIDRISGKAVRREPNIPPDNAPFQDGDPNRDSSRSGTGQAVPEPRPAHALTGRITDAQTGEPLAAVRVRISPSGGGRVHDATTDSNGVYGFAAVESDGPYSIRLAAPEHITPPEWQTPREVIDLRKDRPFVRDYALEKGAKLLLSVFDEKGRPVKGVRFYVAHVSDDWGRGPKDTVQSDAHGVAVLGGLKPDEYMVTAAHRDYALAGQKVVLDQAAQVKSIVFHLQKGIEVVGVATCSDDLPAGGWQIEVRPTWWHSIYCPYDYPIAENGGFILEHVLPGVYRLGIMIPEEGGSRGICTLDVNLPPPTGLLELRIPKPSPHGRVSISGTVKFTGDEYDEGFWIHASGAEGHFGSVYLERGRRSFVLKDLVPGLYDIEITLGGTRNEFRNVKAPGEGVVLEARVAPKVLLRGSVIDRQTRRPVTRFELRTVGERDYRRVSDPNGTFEVGSRGPTCRVQIRAEGYAETISDDLYCDANEPILIELGAPRTVTGLVVDEAGQPIAGATVSFRYSRSVEEPPDGKYITTTDVDGRFRVNQMSTDDAWCWLVFRHPAYARVLKQLKAGPDDATEIQVVLPKGGAIQGYVYDEQGKPLPHMSIHFMDEKHFPYWKENRARLGLATTDDSGFYRIEHLPAELCYAFRENSDDQLGVVRAAFLPVAGATRHLDMGGPWQVSGRLLRQGRPVANVPLLVTYDVDIAQGFKAYALTDANGRFTFYGVPTGRRSLYWAVGGTRNWDGWMKLGTFDFEQGRALDLGEFDATPAEVSVELRMGGPDVPADGWSAAIREYHDQHFWSRRVGQLQPRGDHTDPFVFTDVPPGRYEVLVQRDGYPSVRKSFELGPGEGSRRLVVTIPPGSATISGKIISTNKQLLPLMLRSVDQRLTTEIHTDPGGTFVAKNLPAGRYVIGHALVAASRMSTLVEVSVGEGEHKDITVKADAEDTSQAAGYLVVLIVTEEGLPLATPNVRLEHAGQVILPHFDTDDGKSFAGEPGIYTLHAEYPGYRTTQTTVEMKSKQDRTTQEILEPLVITMMRR